jgi:filamentous hemagglutinin family protein
MALAFFSFAAVADPAPTELPSGGQVTNGSASIAVGGSHMDVNQASQNASLNWQTFNIGKDAQVDFHQPNASAVAVNRIADPNGSQIMGRLNANGQLYLINPNGVLFGQGSQVNVGGLVASTLDISDADAAAGRRTFSSAANGDEGEIVNQGTITAADGGYVALLGQQVSNQGIIQARLGTVALAAGNKISLEFAGDKLVNVEVDNGALQALAENKQLIQADGGTVLMTAKSADALLSSVVNNEGVIEARTVENKSGVIKLLGDMDNGTVNVGGTLDASALPSPSGGEGADGGFIETSAAHVKIADDALITTAAPNGKTGTWLIDPVDFTIAAGSGALSTSGIGASTLSNSLGSSNVAIATDAGTGGNGDIFVNSAVSWSANKLTLTAHRNIAINANLNGSGTASLALEYGQASVGGGGSNYTLSNGAQITLPAGNNFSTKLGTGGATTNYTVITSLGADGSVTGTDLQGMSGGLAGNYVLGANIDAGDTVNWNSGQGFTPVGRVGQFGVPNTPFTGKFDGLGHTISNLFIDRNVNEGVGLFGNVNNALIQNVGLLNVNIYGNTDGTGALVGSASGTTTIRNSYADGGSVRARSRIVGGLVGLNSGSISYSYANVSVESSNGGGATDSRAGGLVGHNNGSISYSYATGSVKGNAGNSAHNQGIGGLVGLQTNSGSISNSYATGAVSAVGGGTNLGGLVGEASGTGGSVTSSYWDITTTGQPSTADVTGGGGGDGTGLTTAQWLTNGPFSSSPSGGAWSTADWSAGNPYPGIKALPYITLTAIASQTYGSAATFGIASILNQNGADASGLVNTGGLSWTASTSTTSAAGTTSAVRGSGATGTTGYQILYAGNLTVNMAPLTVTANGFSKTYDGLAYSGGNGVSYSGFVNSEGSGVLGGALAYGGSAQGAVNAGSYAITPSGLTSSNYAINYASGSLSITPVTLTYTAAPASFLNRQAPYALSGTVNGFIAGDTLASSTTGVLGWTTTGNAASQSGRYSITGSGLSATNYVFTQAAGNATALTLIDSRPVENAVAQLQSTILLPSANSQPETFGLVAENSGTETSSPESVNNAGQNNTNLSSTTTIGVNGPAFKIVHPGVKLPDYMIDVNE